MSHHAPISCRWMVLLLAFLVPAAAAAQDEPPPLDDAVFGAPTGEGEPAGVDDPGFDDSGFEAEPEEEPADTDDYAGEALAFSAPTLRGSTGMWHLSSALTPPEGAFGVGMHVGFFTTSDWLQPHDTDNFIQGDVAFWYAPLKYMEAFLDISSYANSNDHERPTLFQTLGDIRLGAKGYYPVVPWYSLGGELSVLFLNQVGDVAVDGEATSVDLRFLNSFDFQRINASVPIQLHLNFSYFFDHSRNLIDDVEAARASAGDDPYVSRVERFAMNINRVDSFNFAVGIEASHPAIEEWVRLGIEWNLGVPINRSGIDFNCLQSRYANDDSADASRLPADRPSASARCVHIRGCRSTPPSHRPDRSIRSRASRATPLWKMMFGLRLDLSDFEVATPCRRLRRRLLRRLLRRRRTRSPGGGRRARRQRPARDITMSGAS